MSDTGAAAAPLRPRLQELVNELTRRRERLLAAAREVPEPLRARRPAAETWSPLEVLEHLGIVEARVARVLARMVDLAGDAPETETTSVLDRLDAIVAERAQGPLIAVPDTLPSGAKPWDDVLAALEASRRDVLASIARANGRDLSRPRAPHPMFGPLDFHQWLLFIAKHEARHRRQILDAIAR